MKLQCSSLLMPIQNSFRKRRQFSGVQSTTHMRAMPRRPMLLYILATMFPPMTTQGEYHHNYNYFVNIIFVIVIITIVAVTRGVVGQMLAQASQGNIAGHHHHHVGHHDHHCHHHHHNHHNYNFDHNDDQNHLEMNLFRGCTIDTHFSGVAQLTQTDSTTSRTPRFEQNPHFENLVFLILTELSLLCQKLFTYPRSSTGPRPLFSFCKSHSILLLHYQCNL